MKNFPSRAPIGMILGIISGLFSLAPIIDPLASFAASARTFLLPAIHREHARPDASWNRRFVLSWQAHEPDLLHPHAGRQAGNECRRLDPSRHLSVRFVETTPRIFGVWLQTQIYSGREFRELLQLPLALWIAAYFALFFSGLSRRFRATQTGSRRRPVARA